MTDLPYALAQRVSRTLPGEITWSIRVVEQQVETITCRQDVQLPFHATQDMGLMLTVADEQGLGYAATDDLSASGIQNLVARAMGWMQASRGIGLTESEKMLWSEGRRAHYASVPEQPWESRDLDERVALVQGACAQLKIHNDIVDWSAYLGRRCVRSLLIDSLGAEIDQTHHYLLPGMSVVALRGADSQQRSGGGIRRERQGGLEQLPELGFPGQGLRIAEEALALLDAPQCPTDRLDLVLMPAQMVLQIHESIGHPIELDRILGDERNFAGGSFVTPEMFGRHAYGSALLNVTFDPERPEQIASYAFDDDGYAAERTHLICAGVLQRPLGGALSQTRVGLAGVACARAAGWQRPPIDRMANLNLEPGESSLETLIAGIERGVLMDSNRSWSIDDTRDKFQFGCEYGRLIEDGELRGLVRNPNYRGRSAKFWHSLDGVGEAATVEVGGVTRCGKGEPNQLVQVGHASPPCRFRNVEVFGGAA